MEEEFIASNADEWFRAQPNTPFGGILRSEFFFSKKVLANDEVDTPLNVAMKNEVGCIEQKIFMGTNLYKTTKSMLLSCLNSEFDESKIDCELFQPDKSDSIVAKDGANINFGSCNPNDQNDQESSHLEVAKNLNEETANKRKKSKLLTLSESRRKLALRADVMNKNFFRAIRRQIKTQFDEFLVENGLSTSKSKRTFIANLKRFSDHLVKTFKIVQKDQTSKIQLYSL